jgi:serine/threonine-protein kinase
MFDSIGAEDDKSLDPGLRAAFAPVDPALAHDSALEILEARWGIAGAVLLRQEPGEAPERLRQSSDSGAMPNRYRVMGEIARGGIGVVLRGHDVDLGRDVALKVLRTEHAENPSLIRRLVDEAQIGGQLQHPGILPIYDLGLDRARRPFFAMKLVRGRTLAEVLADRKSPEDDQARFLGIFEQLAHAMAYAHTRGVIHRDLKPSNVMVGSFGEVQVVDWGLAKVLSRNGTDDETSDANAPAESVAPQLRSMRASSRSEAGSVLGTPAYMAPEQARGEITAVDERSDVFGLGAILCEILIGCPPYEGTRPEMLDQARTGHVGSTFERLDRCGAGADLIDLAKRCLDPLQQRRPRDAGEVVPIVQAHRENVDARARSAELDAAQAKARAAAERRALRIVIPLAIIVFLASILGGRFYLEKEHQKRLVAEADLRANQSELNLERERRTRIESALEILVPLEDKAHYVLTQAAEAAQHDLDRWIYLLAAVRRVVVRTAATAPTTAARERAELLIKELTKREQQLEEKLEKNGGRNRSIPSTPP